MKSVNKILSNQSGMSLMEVMVALGITGMLAYGSMELIKRTTQSQKAAEARTEKLQYSEEVKNLLRTGVGCRKTLESLPSGLASGASFPLTTIYQGNSQPSGIVTNATLPGSNGMQIKIGQIYLQSSGPNNGVLHIPMETFTANGKKVGNTSETRLSLTYYFNPTTGKVNSCTSDDSSIEAAAIAGAMGKYCDMMNGTYDVNTNKCVNASSKAPTPMSSYSDLLKQVANLKNSYTSLSVPK